MVKKEKVDVVIDAVRTIVGIGMIAAMTWFYLYVRPFPFWLMLIPALMMKIDISKIKDLL